MLRNSYRKSASLTVICSPNQIYRKLCQVFAALVVFHCLAIIARVGFSTKLGGLTTLFDLGIENNFPSAFSSLIFWFCAWAAYMISKAKSNSSQRSWIATSLLLLLLGFDELSQLHERLTEPIRNSLHTSGVLYFAWVIPYALALPLVLFALWRSFTSMPAQARKQVTIAACVFLAGGLGFEMLGAWYTSKTHLGDDWIYNGLATIEEVLEQVGVLLGLRTLLQVLTEGEDQIQVQLIPDAANPDSAPTI